jgi:glycerol-1-phosphate dehydrogenase [NAD(P)+]
MPLLARMVGLPLSVDVRRGAVEGLGPLLADRRISADGRVAVAVGPGQGERVVASLRPSLGRADVFRVEGGTVDAAERLADDLHQGWYDAVVGIGGGRTIDVAKYAASRSGLPMVSVATSLAHDGLASPVASLEHRGRKGSYGVHLPIAVIVDIDFVLQCPPEQLRSGVGDAVSNLTALADWELAGRERGEPIDGLAVALARTGAEALLRRTDELSSETLLTTLAEALILGGVAMAVAGSSRPCSGACHEIAHAIDELYPGTASHGEEVAVGSLFAAHLQRSPIRAALEACLRRHGVPRTPRDLGLTDDEFVAAVVEAPATRPDRYTILEHRGMDEAEIRRELGAFLEAAAA